MAKKVTGTFGEEKIVLNDAATETTLEKLLEAIKNMPGASESEKKKAAKATRDYAESTEEADEALQDYTDTVEESRSSLGRMTNGIGFFAGKMTALGSKVEDLASKFFVGGNTIEDVFGNMPIVGTFAGIIQDNVDTFREISSTGATFGNSLSNMRIAAANAEVSLASFQQMVSNNSERMAMLGGSVSDGARQFGQISQQLRTSEVGEQLLGMGFTVEEINDGLGNYIELQARQGRLERMSQAQLREGSAEYLKQLDQLAKITGKNRDQQAELINENAALANVAAMRGKLEGQALQNFDSTMALASDMGEEVGTVFKDLADGIPQTEFGKKISAIVPGFADLAAAAGRGEISQRQFAERMQDIAPQMSQFRDQIGAAGIQALGGTEGMQSFFDSIVRMEEFAAKAADPGDVEAEQARRSEISQALLGFEQTISTIRSKIVHTLLTSGVFDRTMGMLEGFADTLSPESIEDKMSGLINVFKNFNNWLSGFIDDIKENGFMTAIQENIGPVISDGVKAITSALGKGIISAITSPAVIGAVAAGFGALFAAGKIKDVLSDKLAGLFGGDDRDSARRSSSRGRSKGGLGRTLKGLSSGLLGGIAKGLMMFANPVILKGATILGASIGIIGAGIAGATWLLGNSLPSLSEGLQSFEDLDGDALLKAGAGMAAVAGGLAAFGAGSAVAGIGNLVGSITNGIAKMFGGDDPLEKMKKFEEYDFDKARIENNADALMAFSAAMAASGGAQAASGLGNLVGNITKGIVELFGGDTSLPYDEVREFGKVDLGNREKIVKNAEILNLFSRALSNFPEDIPSFRGQGVFESIGSFFTGNAQMPWDAMNQFAEITLNNPEQLSKNVTSLSDFGSALKQIPDDLPTFEGTGFFSKIGNFFSGQEQMPWDAMNQFAEITLNNPEQLSKNISSLSQFGNALKQIPDDLPTFDGQGFMSKLGNFFSGQEQMPWDSLEQFGKVNLDNEKISQNAESLKVFGDVLSDLQASGIQEGLEIPRLRLDRISKAVNNFSDIDQKSLENIRTMSKDLERLSSFNDNLDTNPVNDYTEAVKALTDALSNLNEEIADNPRLGVTTPNAPTSRTGDTDTQSQSTEQLNRLNTIMTDILGVLLESNDMNKKQLRSTRAMTVDLYRGV